MSEPNTSEPLHSSCTRQVILVRDRRACRRRRTDRPWCRRSGGRNTCRSGRVTSSGNMPAVCSNSVRRRFVSVVPKRSAMPGRYQTGSMAIFDHRDAAVGVHDRRRRVSSRPAASAACDLGQVEPRLRDRDARADIDAFGDLGAEVLGDQMAPRDRARRCVAGSVHCWKRPDGRGRDGCW